MLSVAPGQSTRWAHTLTFSHDATARAAFGARHTAAAGPASAASRGHAFTLGTVGGALLIGFVGSLGCLWARAQTRGFAARSAAKQLEADRVYVKLAA